MYVTWVTSCALESYGMITTLDEIEKVQFSLEGQFKIEALGIFYWRRGQQRYTLCTYTLYKEADIQGYKTNHSPRATTTTGLYESGVDEQQIMEQTGQRSLEGVRSYKRTSDKQRQALSDVLNR